MSCDWTPHGSSTAVAATMKMATRADALDDDDLRKHVSAQADHVDEPRADDSVGTKQRFRSVLHDDVGQVQSRTPG